MSLVEHYFENLIFFDKDSPGEPNKEGLSQEVIDAIETCYFYVCNRVFINRDDIDNYMKEWHDFDRSERGWRNADDNCKEK